MNALPIVERLRRKCTTANKYGTQGTKPINPDGPEAAELITELYEALEHAQRAIKHEPFFDSDPELQDVLADVERALTKARDQ